MLRDLQAYEGVIYRAGLTRRAKIIAKVTAPNKQVFDNKIMYQIQTISGVTTTRSLIIINDMHYASKELSTGSPISEVDAWAGQREKEVL